MKRRKTQVLRVKTSNDSMQLNLTPDSNKTIITIVGNTDVEIHWEGQDLMTISLIHRGDFGIGGHAEYEVKVVKAERFKDKIIITLPATGQRMELNVSYDPGEGNLPSTRSVTLYASILVCLAVLIATVAFLIRLIDRPDQPRSSTPATPSIAAPATPDHHVSPGHSLQQSPRTPQPFVEYIRRTIDDTPYYKRDGRRRFNPQNTY